MSRQLRLFEGYGVELEYMIVDTDTLAVRPISEILLHDATGLICGEVEQGPLAWSNELTAHVIELKTNGPAETLDGLAAEFQSQIGRINALLSPHRAALMPTAMHPLMNPLQEMVLWQHDDSPVYETFHRIFDCRGHGWANLQSVHINLPFCGDEEFARLHAAIRVVLPLLPALAASSPVVEGRPTGRRDSRLHHYRSNARRIPSVTAQVVPEPVFSRCDYEREILQRMYRDVAPHDPHHILQHEWLNARGAIARFARGAIEIRVLDIQEHPAADLAVCAAIVAVLRNLVAEENSPLAQQQACRTEDLARLLDRTIQQAEQAVVDAPAYLNVLGMGASSAADITAADVWTHLLQQHCAGDRSAADSVAPVREILTHGTLATRILARLGPAPAREDIVIVYRELMQCLASGKTFHA